MLLTTILAALASLSLALTLWQLVVGLRFPLHHRVVDKSFAPAVTLLKPLKGCDAETAACLRSWLAQDYAGPVQILFGVASADDPVCATVRELLAAHPRSDARLVICAAAPGANAKVSTLAQLEPLARHDLLVISDADVWAPPDFLANVLAPLRESPVGLVHCFYRLARPSTLAMRWEAIAINADFWSQVLQARSLQPPDFALGAALAVRRPALAALGGFPALADFLADDYQLGHRLARAGHRLELCPVVVECREAPMNWRQVWAHQLRWARTIRVCQPVAFFFSLLGNATLWPALLLAFGRAGDAHRWGFFLMDGPGPIVFETGFSTTGTAHFVLACVLTRLITALWLQRRLTGTTAHYGAWWLVPVKDLLGVVLWALAFVGNKVTWRGVAYRVQCGGRLARI